MRLAPHTSVLASMKTSRSTTAGLGGSWCFRGSPPANDQHLKVRPPNIGQGLGRSDRSHRQNLDFIYGHFSTWNISAQAFGRFISWLSGQVSGKRSPKGRMSTAFRIPQIPPKPEPEQALQHHCASCWWFLQDGSFKISRCLTRVQAEIPELLHGTLPAIHRSWESWSPSSPETAQERTPRK